MFIFYRHKRNFCEKGEIRSIMAVMDEKMLRDYAIEAGRRYTNSLNESVANSEDEWIKKVESGESKVRGIYRKPFSNKWEIHYSYNSANSVSSWIIHYEPKPNLSDEAHIEEILRLIWEHQSFR